MYKINEFIFFNEDDLLENYNSVRDKVNADIKKEFDSKAFQNKNFLKTNIKYYVDEVPGFYVKEIPKENLDPNCLARISLD